MCSCAVQLSSSLILETDVLQSWMRFLQSSPKMNLNVEGGCLNEMKRVSERYFSEDTVVLVTESWFREIPPSLNF